MITEVGNARLRNPDVSATGLNPGVVKDPEAAPDLRRFEDVIARARAERDIVLLSALERTVRPVRFEPGRVEIALTETAEPDLPQRLGHALQAWTGRRWIVAVSREPTNADTVHEARRKSQAALMEEVRSDPLVRHVLDRFPGAQIVGVREREADADRPTPEPSLDAVPADTDEE
jgi:DNA polymerase-3 subunit gamma/tau